MNYKLLLPSYRTRSRFVLDAIRAHRPDGRVARGLSLGSGEGEYDRALAAHCDRLDACDLNEEDVAYASALNRDVTHLHYAVQDGTQLGYADAQFDLVVCLEVIEHVDDPDKLVAEIHRVLAPGGLLVLTGPSHRFPITYDPVNWVLHRFEKQLPFGAYGYGHTWLLQAQRLGDDLVSAGFRVDEVHYLSKHLVGLFECYLPVLAQRLLKGNAANTQSGGPTGGAVLRPSTEAPPLVWVTDGVISLDSWLFRRSRGSIGLGIVAERL